MKSYGRCYDLQDAPTILEDGGEEEEEGGKKRKVVEVISKECDARDYYYDKDEDDATLGRAKWLFDPDCKTNIRKCEQAKLAQERVINQFQTS